MSPRTVTPAAAQALLSAVDRYVPGTDPHVAAIDLVRDEAFDLAETIAAEPARIAAAVEADRSRVARVLSRLGVQDHGGDPLAALESWADDEHARCLAAADEHNASLAAAVESERAAIAARIEEAPVTWGALTPAEQALVSAFTSYLAGVVRGRGEP